MDAALAFGLSAGLIIGCAVALVAALHWTGATSAGPDVDAVGAEPMPANSNEAAR